MEMNVSLPSVAERLKDLEPSKDLLEFYRNRLHTYESDDGKISKRLSEFKMTCDHQYALEKDLMERDEENTALRTALSDIQACLYQEREHVLRLYAENDRLKIRELEDRKKIQQFLTLIGDKFPSADIHFILKDYPGKLDGAKSAKTTRHQTLPKPKTATEPYDSSEFFKLQIEGLKAEMEEQTKFSRENIEALTEDLRVTRQEADAQYHRHAEKISSVTEKLKISQDLLAKITEDYLGLKRSNSNKENRWLAQRDEMGLHIRTLRKQISSDTVDSQSLSSVASTRISSLQRPIPQMQNLPGSIKAEMHSLQVNLDRAYKMCDTYKQQCMKLEEELAQLREQKDASKSLLNERSEKLSNQLKLISGKYKDLEKRHKSEVEGFRSDVKILKAHLQKVEKQLLKTAIKLTQTQADQDMLQNIHNTTTKSKYLSDNLRAMKAQIVQLEQDLKLI